ncbi:hypothetical protein HH214_09355 [Mucilaginibacter robiniae]|uniref:Uncharacterized protein n=1 Tax=Mucilaginibacter robiniae TaxID=2728022 RepID=A0A7L5E6P8_9SPHI|nr:hypothetical protein [Mucilaginibacter robiniae]QJD96066.1 hypothetical protein HH214_09355 [Mucilaginibacter robiniae]
METTIHYLQAHLPASSFKHTSRFILEYFLVMIVLAAACLPFLLIILLHE